MPRPSNDTSRSSIIMSTRSPAPATDPLDPSFTSPLEVSDNASALSERRPKYNRWATQPSPRSSTNPQVVKGLSELMSSPGHRSGESYFATSSSSSEPFSSSSHPSGTLTDPSSYPSTPQDSMSSPVGSSLDRRVSSPRVRNDGTILARHGTFTANRSRNSTTTQSSSSSSGHNREIYEQISSIYVEGLSAEEKAKLVHEAQRGDQLAMYRLGWRREKASARHTLGSNEDVWGPYQPPSTGIVRSSESSYSTTASRTADGKVSLPGIVGTAVSDPQRKVTASDLFSDAAVMTLNSNAVENAKRNQERQGQLAAAKAER